MINVTYGMDFCYYICINNIGLLEDLKAEMQSRAPNKVRGNGGEWVRSPYIITK